MYANKVFLGITPVTLENWQWDRTGRWVGGGNVETQRYLKTRTNAAQQLQVLFFFPEKSR